MAAALVLSFPGRTRADYDAVNAKLDFDTQTAAGEWPSGLLSHAAGTRDDGSLCVIEVWESREAQGRFMHESSAPRSPPPASRASRRSRGSISSTTPYRKAHRQAPDAEVRGRRRGTLRA